MKFVLALIRALGIILSICLFCAFMYYTFINQHQTENDKMLTYGSLLLFVLSTVITSMVSVGFENYQNKKQDSALIHRITDKIQALSVPTASAGAVEPDMSPLIKMLTEQNNDTADMLRQGLATINQLLSGLPNDNAAKKVDFGIESLNNRLTEIQETLSAKKQMPDMAEISATAEKLMQFGKDFENIKNQMTRSMSEISQEMSVMKKQQKNYDEALKDIASKLDYVLPFLHGVVQKNISAQHGFANLSDETDDLTVSEIKNNIRDIMPPEDDKDDETEILPTIEVEEAAEPDMANDSDINRYLTEDIEPVSLETKEESAEKISADTPEYVADNPFGAPSETSVSDYLPEINAGIDPTLYGSDKPFGTENAGTTEDMPDLPPPTDPTVLESDNPYGVVKENADYEVPVESGALQADNPFGAPVEKVDENVNEDDENSQLKSIFNDKFAEEMAALDILKDDDETPEKKSAEDYEDIDISTLIDAEK